MRFVQNIVTGEEQGICVVRRFVLGVYDESNPKKRELLLHECPDHIRTVSDHQPDLLDTGDCEIFDTPLEDGYSTDLQKAFWLRVSKRPHARRSPGGKDPGQSPTANVSPAAPQRRQREEYQ